MERAEDGQGWHLVRCQQSEAKAIGNLDDFHLRQSALAPFVFDVVPRAFVIEVAGPWSFADVEFLLFLRLVRELPANKGRFG